GVWAVLQALRFAAGIAILLFGVRMFLAEIVPAFKGLSEKVLPGTKPALDLPVTFTRAPTSVMLGFLASAFVFLVLMLIFAATCWFVLVPPMIMLFFGGGAGGVFGNAVAGWRGALFGGVLNGIVLAFGQAIGWSLYAGTAPELATLADADWYAGGGRLGAQRWRVAAGPSRQRRCLGARRGGARRAQREPRRARASGPQRRACGEPCGRGARDRALRRRCGVTCWRCVDCGGAGATCPFRHRPTGYARCPRCLRRWDGVEPDPPHHRRESTSAS